MRVIFLSLIVSFCGCGMGNNKAESVLQSSQQSEQNDTIKKYQIVQVSENEYDKLSINTLSIDSSDHPFVKTDNKGSVIISPSNGKKVKFNAIKSSDDETEEVTYRYLGEMKVGYHIVQAKYWEGSECYLVNAKTGEIDTLWSVPIISKNGAYLVSKSLEYGLEGAPNGIQIFKCGKNALIKIVEIDQNEWIPVDIRWMAESSFIIKAISVNSYFKERKDVTFYKVVINS